VEFRDLSSDILEKLDAALYDCVKTHDGLRKVKCNVSLQNQLAPVNMAADLQEKLAEQARRHGARHIAIHSGAIHDAMVLARKIPTAMLFIPSIDGRSHTPDENSKEDQIALGAQVFCDALVETAATYR
jgi:N-carbamoyl-L-amino-acid hydrolase